MGNFIFNVSGRVIIDRMLDAGYLMLDIRSTRDERRGMRGDYFAVTKLNCI